MAHTRPGSPGVRPTLGSAVPVGSGPGSRTPRAAGARLAPPAPAPWPSWPSSHWPWRYSRDHLTLDDVALRQGGAESCAESGAESGLGAGALGQAVVLTGPVLLIAGAGAGCLLYTSPSPRA